MKINLAIRVPAADKQVPIALSLLSSGNERCVWQTRNGSIDPDIVCYFTGRFTDTVNMGFDRGKKIRKRHVQPYDTAAAKFKLLTCFRYCQHQEIKITCLMKMSK